MRSSALSSRRMHEHSPEPICLGEVDSTNRYAARNLAELPDGQLILAERQTDGRGRLNRAWISHSPNNLYASLILKTFPDSTPPLINLSQYLALVVAEVLGSYSVEAKVKWPNDVLVDNKKIAGILGESVYRGSRFEGYILGIGMNLNMTLEDVEGIPQPATSLNLQIRRTVSRNHFLALLLEAFGSEYGRFLELGFPLIRERFLKSTPFLGREITIRSLSVPITGTAKDISRDGSLILITEYGEKTITLGDVEC